MTNNDILKKLRVALKLRDTDIVKILALADFKMSETELSALFRNEDHPNYKPAGDQVLRNFLNGLIIHMRGPMEKPKWPSTLSSTTRCTWSCRRGGNTAGWHKCVSSSPNGCPPASRPTAVVGNGSITTRSLTKTCGR